MLSFDTTHTLTGRLVQAETDAETRGWGGPPVLLVLHDQPCTPSGSPHRLRRMRAVSFTLDPADVAERTAGIAAVLQDLAEHLATDCSRTQPDLAYEAHGLDPRLDPGPDVGIRAGQITVGMLTAPPPARLLAWAVLYEDVTADADGIGEVRRVDAVDIDGRLYQLTRHRGEPHVVAVIDDEPDPGDTPATHPGLAALLTATRHLPHHAREGVQP